MVVEADIEAKAERMRGRERVFRKQTERKEPTKAAPKLWDDESRRLFNEERHVITVKKDGVTVAAYRSDRYKVVSESQIVDSVVSEANRGEQRAFG